MLNDVIFKVLNKVLDENIESVDCYDRGYKLEVITKSKILYDDFIRKTKHNLHISENDISNYDSDDEDLTFTIDLTEDFINKIIAYVKYDCLNEFENMRRIK